MVSQTQVTLPASLIPELEAWGRLTAKLFGALRRYAGLKPKKVPKSQAWYWSKKWQEWERQADEQLARGEYKEFDSIDELIADLHSHV